MSYVESFKEDCPEFEYFPIVFPKVNRIIAIGDVHGDFQLLKKLLLLAKVIDKQMNWIGGDTFVIQTGDQIDSCRTDSLACDNPLATPNDAPHDLKIINFLDKLHKLARKKDGAVISLLGNHELLNIMGKMDYVSYKNVMQSIKNGDYKGALEKRKKIFSYKGKVGKTLICTHPTSIIIGRNLFVHAGILPKLLDKLDITSKENFEDLNVTVRRWLLKKINKEYINEIINSEKISPFWNRILGNIPHNATSDDELCVKYLEPVLKTLKIGSMIVGHTPQFVSNDTGISDACDHKLWRIDTGSAKSFNKFDESFQETQKIMEQRKPQMLEIVDDEKFKIII